jgi:ribosomal protein S12 methylthiotransferase
MAETKVGIITMGCPKNMVDSEKLAASLQKNGFWVEHENQDADIIVINTCGFINDAKEESINEILNQIERKKQNENLKIVVTGCLAERYRDQLQKEIPEIDDLFGVHDYDKVVENITGNHAQKPEDRILSTPSHFAYLKISEGCNRNCSFCAIPLIRGKQISVEMDLLIAEAKQLAAKGVKELIVIAQDTVSYGLDLYGEKRIAPLLNNLSEIEGIEWIRLMYTYPAGFPDELIDEMASNPKIVKYVDIPLQHFSSPILQSMKRGIDSVETEKLITKLRKRIPSVSIRSTFIVGYPGETVSQFFELYEFVKRMKFERFGVFAYSPEEDTPAFVLKDDIPHRTKMKRMSDLLRIHEEFSVERNEKMVGTEMQAIVDHYDAEDQIFVGRTAADAPEIDNIVRFLPASGKQIFPGMIVNVKVVSAGLFDLECEIVE